MLQKSGYGASSPIKSCDSLAQYFRFPGGSLFSDRVFEFLSSRASSVNWTEAIRKISPVHQKTHLHFGPLNDNDRQLLLCLCCICTATLAANLPTTHSSYSLSGIECLYLLLSPPLTPLKVKYSHSESTNVFSKHQHRDSEFYWGYGERTHSQHSHTPTHTDSHKCKCRNGDCVWEITELRQQYLFYWHFFASPQHFHSRQWKAIFCFCYFFLVFFFLVTKPTWQSQKRGKWQVGMAGHSPSKMSA